MSYWVYLTNSGNDPVNVPNHSEGGTYVLGGTDQAELNVTYNYSGHISSAFNYAAMKLGLSDSELREITEQGLRYLQDKRAGEVMALLSVAAHYLGDKPDADYWQPSAGNAGHALTVLAKWAILNPDAGFSVS